MKKYNSLNEYLTTRRGLKDLCTIYGNTCLPLTTCIDDLKRRSFWVGGKLYVATDDDMLQTLREMAYGDMVDLAPAPLDLAQYTYDEDGTLPASGCRMQEAYAIVEEPCGPGFRYIGFATPKDFATPKEYEQYKREHPLCYG